jgi:hypothetical protein
VADQPNFIIAGAAKSGTTSLVHYLRQHPDVFIAREKESHFLLFEGNRPTFAGPGDDQIFNANVITDRVSYARCFRSAGRAFAVGEASVYYVYRVESLRRALAMDPNMRFVVSLRDPSTRARSAYGHMVRDGWEDCSDYADALGREEDRIAANWSFGWHYRTVGDYLPQIETMLALVPRDQVKFVLFERFTADPVAASREVFDFIGVDPAFTPMTDMVFNASGQSRSRLIDRLLTQPNAVKSTAKRVLPYNFGVRLAHSLLQRNLRALPVGADSTGDRAVVGGDRYSSLARLTGLDLSGWV